VPTDGAIWPAAPTKEIGFTALILTAPAEPFPGSMHARRMPHTSVFLQPGMHLGYVIWARLARALE